MRSAAAANWRLALTLVDELVRGGLTDACLAPGSRSAPVALALNEHPGVRLHVHLDERSAGFFALGAAKASGRPAVVLCTSGTAAANLYPAVVEADHAHAPLLVLTADRPPELRGTGANQTVDQLKLYGSSVRLFCEVGAPVDGPGAGAYWRSLGSRAWAAALGPPAGPVHLNLAFAEPLLPERLDDGPAPGRPDGAPWTRSSPRARLPDPDEVLELAEAVRGAPRGLLVAGWGAELDPAAVDAFTRVSGWPVLADPLSGARRGPAAVSTYDGLLRLADFAAAHRPDLVLRLGATPTSKALTGWLDASVPQVMVDPRGGWPDPARAVGRHLAADPSALLRALAAAIGGGWRLDERLAAGGGAGEAGDRRAAGLQRGALRGQGRPRPGRGAARRGDPGGRVQHARARRGRLRRASRGPAPAGQPRRQRDRRAGGHGARGGGRQRRAGGGAVRRPVAAARRRQPARGRRPVPRRGAGGLRQQRRRDLLVPAAGAPAGSGVRAAVRHAPRAGPGRPRRGPAAAVAAAHQGLRAGPRAAGGASPRGHRGPAGAERPRRQPGQAPRGDRGGRRRAGPGAVSAGATVR